MGASTYTPRRPQKGARLAFENGSRSTLKKDHILRLVGTYVLRSIGKEMKKPTQISKCKG